MTASQCAERLGDSPAGCSYHLRQLAKWGFVDETGEGRGRERPWRYVPMGNSFGSGESESQRAAAQLLTGVVNERRFNQVRRFQATAASLPKEWDAAARSDDFTFWATLAETEELGRQIFELLAPFQARTLAGERPDASRLVQWLLYAFPLPTSPEPADHA